MQFECTKDKKFQVFLCCHVNNILLKAVYNLTLNFSTLTVKMILSCRVNRFSCWIIKKQNRPEFQTIIWKKGGSRVAKISSQGIGKWKKWLKTYLRTSRWLFAGYICKFYLLVFISLSKGFLLGASSGLTNNFRLLEIISHWLLLVIFRSNVNRTWPKIPKIAWYF